MLKGHWCQPIKLQNRLRFQHRSNLRLFRISETHVSLFRSVRQLLSISGFVFKSVLASLLMTDEKMKTDSDQLKNRVLIGH
jgi:hypothetical protein